MNRKPWLGSLNFFSDNRESKSRNLKRGGIVALAFASALFRADVEAQQPMKQVYRIAILSPATRPRPVIDALQERLRDLGYTETRNVVFEERYANFKAERLPQLASELVKLRPNIIFTHSVTGARAAKHATSTIPIVIGAAGDLVQEGIIVSLARPGGNVTGVTLLSTELEGKRLELLKETSRKLSHVAVLVNSANSAWENYPQVLEPAALALKLRLERAEVSQSTEIEDAFAVMLRSGADGVLIVSDPMFQAYQNRIAEVAARHHLPSISEVPGFAEAGGLIQYRDGPTRSSLHRQDPHRGKAGRPAGGAADKIRIPDQLENRETTGFDHTAGNAGTGRQGPKMIL